MHTVDFVVLSTTPPAAYTSIPERIAVLSISMHTTVFHCSTWPTMVFSAHNMFCGTHATTSCRTLSTSISTTSAHVLHAWNVNHNLPASMAARTIHLVVSHPSYAHGRSIHSPFPPAANTIQATLHIKWYHALSSIVASHGAPLAHWISYRCNMGGVEVSNDECRRIQFWSPLWSYWNEGPPFWPIWPLCPVHNWGNLCNPYKKYQK